MNWREITYDWNHARAFLAVVEEGSLSAAARVLGQTQPTIGRQINALEEELGVTLFERSGRSFCVTQTGQELAENVRVMSEAAGRVSLIASGRSQAIEGLVRITASDVLAVHLLPKVIDKLHSIAPNIQIEIVASDSIRNIAQREADIAIRHVRPEDPDLIARLIHEAKAHFYAAKSYLDRRGHPVSEADLSRHDFIGFGDTQQTIDYLTPLGIMLTASNFKVSSSNGLVAWEFMKRGFGISPMSVDVARTIAEVEMVLPSRAPIVFPVWLVTHRELHTSKRIRLVYDLLAEELPKNMA